MNEHYRIGLLLNDFGSEYTLSLESGIIQSCTEQGIPLYVFSVGEIGHVYSTYEYQKRAAAALITKHNLDGLIFQAIPQLAHSSTEQLTEYMHSFSPLPVVSIGADIPEVPSITIDEKSGLRSVIRHLINVHHCKNIILMGAGTSVAAACERQKVFIEELSSAGLPLEDDAIMDGHFTYQEAETAIKAYAAHHTGLRNVDAIVALNDDMACACMDFCRNEKIRVPEDIKITGYDDIVRASYTSPTLTSITQHLNAQGRLAVQTLIQKIQGAAVPHLQVIPTKALYRQSCGCISRNENDINAVMDGGSKITSEMQGTFLSGSEWYKKRFQMQFLIGYQESKQNARSLPTLRKTVINDLRNSDMQSIAICLYETPVQTGAFLHFSLPHKAYVFAAHDSRTGCSIDGSEEDIIFDPNDMIIPDGILDQTSGRFYVIPLYQCSVQYGYIIFRPGDYDDTMYLMLCSILSSIIDESYSFMFETTAACTDELTSLLNERGFMQRGQRTIQNAVSGMQSGLVIYGDIDGLKEINAAYGHEAGDRAIAAGASLLKSIFRSSDILARLHEDDFGIVASGLSQNVFDRISQKLDEKIIAWNKETKEPFTLSVSLGTAVFSPQNDILGALLKQAEEKLHAGKHAKHTKS